MPVLVGWAVAGDGSYKCVFFARALFLVLVSLRGLISRLRGVVGPLLRWWALSSNQMVRRAAGRRVEAVQDVVRLVVNIG